MLRICHNSIMLQKIQVRTIIKKYKHLYIMAALVLMYYILFCYIPMYGIIIAFKDFNVFKGVLGSDWVGFKFFEKMVNSPYFLKAFRNTLIISLLKIIFVFPIPIVLALLLNEISLLKFKKIIQTIIYLPHFISWMVLSGIFLNLLSINYGAINYAISILGFEKINFMGDPKYFRSLIIITDIYKTAGWGTIIYLAAIAGINPELYDAALIDGANRWQQTLRITLPSILNVIIMLFILRLSQLLNAGFDQVFVLYNSLVYETGDILDTYVYREGIRSGNYSYATAVGLVKSTVGFILIYTSDRFFKKVSGRGIF